MSTDQEETGAHWEAEGTLAWTNLNRADSECTEDWLESQPRGLEETEYVPQNCFATFSALWICRLTYWHYRGTEVQESQGGGFVDGHKRQKPMSEMLSPTHSVMMPAEGGLELTNSACWLSRGGSPGPSNRPGGDDCNRQKRQRGLQAVMDFQG